MPKLIQRRMDEIDTFQYGLIVWVSSRIAAVVLLALLDLEWTSVKQELDLSPSQFF